MWKPTRKEDEPAMPMQESRPTPTAPVPNPVVRQPESGARSEVMRGVDVATIGKSVVVKGELSGSEDLFVDGQVEGSVALRGQSLTIGPNGRVRANIEARNVIIHGQVDGNVTASDRVELRKSASLTGDIATARIAIDDGAYFKGTIDIQKPEPAARSEAKPQVMATSAPAAHVSPASQAGSAAAPITTQGSLLEPKKA
jgi:cytoskeletal protein CcmA (bactofilin family)